MTGNTSGDLTETPQKDVECQIWACINKRSSSHSVGLGDMDGAGVNRNIL